MGARSPRKVTSVAPNSKIGGQQLGWPIRKRTADTDLHFECRREALVRRDTGFASQDRRYHRSGRVALLEEAHLGVEEGYRIDKELIDREAPMGTNPWLAQARFPRP